MKKVKNATNVSSLEVLYIMAATCFLDEIWFTPAYKYANSKYSINKEIDKRHE